MPQRYQLLVLLGAGAGLRQGEAFGLAVNQVDTAAGMITVSQQVIVVDRRPVLAPPKTTASVAFSQARMCPQSAPATS